MSTAEAHWATQVETLLSGARTREEALADALKLVERIARETGAAPERAGWWSRLRRSVSRRATHAGLAERLERLAIQSARLSLALERLDVELREWEAWTDSLQVSRDTLRATEDSARSERASMEPIRRQALERPSADPSELERVNAAIEALEKRMDSAHRGARRLRDHAAAARELHAALIRARAQLQRLLMAVSTERSALEGNVAIRAQVSRRKELVRDISQAVGEAETASLARETLKFLTGASDLLRKHQQARGSERVGP